MMKKPAIRLVVAYTKNMVIGKDGGMPWHLPSDLAHFKRSTMGLPIIMGRKTWLSLGRPLPGRRNIVLSRDASLKLDGADCFTDLEGAINSCDTDTVCIIGGEQVFRLALPMATEIYATEIQSDIAGDTWFPELSESVWQESGRAHQPAENGLDFDFVVYTRK